MSDIPFASLDRVFPVQGAITKISSIDFGPIGSASGIVIIGDLPVICEASSKKSLHFHGYKHLSYNQKK